MSASYIHTIKHNFFKTLQVKGRRVPTAVNVARMELLDWDQNDVMSESGNWKKVYGKRELSITLFFVF